jgi:predicted nucleic acid-binding protein
MKYYLDTCIWIDFLEERDEFVVKRVFDILLNHKILISRKVFVELEKYIEPVNLLEFKNVVLVDDSELQKTSAMKLARERNIPFGDVIHAIIAKDNDSILLTRDRHFLKLRDIAQIELL